MKEFNFSKRHLDLMARDEESVMGWRYEPRIMFERGRGVMIIDVDGNEYYDATSGMMCMSLGHSHPELTETIREQAGRLVHTSSWYSNEPSIEFAELNPIHDIANQTGQLLCELVASALGKKVMPTFGPRRR